MIDDRRKHATTKIDDDRDYVKNIIEEAREKEMTGASREEKKQFLPKKEIPIMTEGSIDSL